MNDILRLPTGLTRPTKTNGRPANTTHSTEEVISMLTIKTTRKVPSNLSIQAKDQLEVKEEVDIE